MECFRQTFAKPTPEIPNRLAPVSSSQPFMPDCRVRFARSVSGPSDPRFAEAIGISLGTLLNYFRVGNMRVSELVQSVLSAG